MSIIPAREPLKGGGGGGEEEEEGGRHICPRAIRAQSSPVYSEHVPKLGDYSLETKKRIMSRLQNLETLYLTTIEEKRMKKNRL